MSVNLKIYYLKQEQKEIRRKKRIAKEMGIDSLYDIYTMQLKELSKEIKFLKENR